MIKTQYGVDYNGPDEDLFLPQIEGINMSSGGYCKVSFINCSVCKKLYTRKYAQQRYCSEECKINSGIQTYRRACKFKITKKSHPELFNIELLKQYGWYRASNHPDGYNPSGATWDHLFRVEDGFKLGISPTILSHPANAQMISWEENIRRTKSTITYEELLERIKNF